MNEILQEYKDFVWGNYQKNKTRHIYESHPRLCLEWINKPLEQITQEDINRYIHYCYGYCKRNTLSLKFWSTQNFFKWVGRNDLQLPKITPIDAGKQALNEIETQKILDTIETLSPLHQLIFYLEYDAIRRPSEIQNLKLKDRYGEILKYDGKTGIKQCIMTERLQNAWDEYLKIRPIPSTEQDSEYLILHYYGKDKGNHLTSKCMISRIIKEVMMYSRVELPNGEKPTNYLVKRTSISRQLKECPDPKIIQLQAGHTKLETTMKYNRINEQDIKNYLSLFEDKRDGNKRKRKINYDKFL
ncbi:MAG: site-specific integrase [Thermoplasmatales archaeon]|nr:site-specific integrase [Thermoplasmatales archaeon]